MKARVAAASCRPGPISTASTLASSASTLAMASAAMPPASVSASAMTRASASASAIPRRDRRDRRDRELAGAGAQRRRRRQQGGARHLRAAGDHQRRAALFLVGVAVGLGQRPGAQQPRIDLDGRADLGHHDFGAAGRSGAAVTGAPASRSGATKFSSCRTSLPRRPALGSKRYDVMPQLGTSPRRSIARICVLVEPLEQVAQAVDDHLVGDDQHAVAAVLARQHVEQAAQAQDHVAPALAAGRAEVELADVQALLGELGVLGADAERRQPVEDAELLLAQALVAHAGDRRRRRARRRRGAARRGRGRRSGARARRAS